MSEQAVHPSEAQLSAYNRGLLSPDEAVEIETHVSDCESCCETIVSLSSDDTFVELLKDAKALPIDESGAKTKLSAATGDIPPELAEHPRYEILRLIGKGGMGDVYEGIHRKMERRVALKVINRDLFRKAEAVNRFHREVKAAAQLTHSNIVTAYDADQAGDFHFLVMEFVDGVDLSQIVKERGALSIDDACNYIREAAIGLQHAHERGMVHRDIKPHNLMVTADGTVKILDFGLASLAPDAVPFSDSVAARSDLTAAGAIMGTPDFISPEQAIDARQADIRSDIYSLGATLYYLLSGRVPFDDGSVMHKLESHAQAEPDSLDSLRDDVPPELAAIVSTMMAKDPNERYLTPSEVAEALEAFLRTWTPDDGAAAGHVPLGGGNNSGSGGQEPGSGSMGPDWFADAAKWLYYLAMIPVGLLLINVFVFDDVDAVAADRIWYYVVPSLLLGTVSGAFAGIHQIQTGRADESRVIKLTDQTLLIAAILIGSVIYYFASGNDGQVHLEVTQPGDTTMIGTHPLTIIDTSGEKPLGGTSGTHQDDAAGTTTHFFESANGRYKIELTDDVLTVNGDEYTLQNASDSIRIVDDRVEITQVTALPSKPELEITGKTINKGASGLPSVYDWNFKGREVGELKVRLLLAQNGTTEVVQEFDFEELPAEFTNKVRLEVKDAGRSPKGRRVNAVLFVESPVTSRSATVNEDKGLSIDVESPFSNKIERADLEPLESGHTEMLLALSYWKGDMTHDLSMESMIAATKDGNVTFLFVTLEWSTANPDELREKEGLLDGESIRPGVEVENYSDQNGHHWKLAAQKVEAVRVRLLHIADGKVEVASESLLQGNGKDRSTIDLKLSQTDATDQPDSVTTTIEIASDNMQFSRSKSGPVTVEGAFQVAPAVTSGGLAWNDPTILYHHANWSGDLTYSRNTESMIEASKEDARFVALEVEWVAEGEQDVPEWLAQYRPAEKQGDAKPDAVAIQGRVASSSCGRQRPSGSVGSRSRHPHGDHQRVDHDGGRRSRGGLHLHT